jgi:hypothetical protein
MSDPAPVSNWSSWLFRISVTFLLLAILVVGIALVTIPMLSDTEWVKRSLLDILEGVSGGSIQLDTLEVRLLPSPQVQLTGLSFDSSSEEVPVVLRARQVEVAFGWDALWSHHLVLTSGVLHEPELTLWMPEEPKPRKATTWKVPAIGELVIHDGRVHLHKSSPTTTTPMTLSWEQIHLTVTASEPGGPTTFGLTAQAADTDQPARWSVYGTLSFLQPDETEPVSIGDEPVSPMHLAGRVEVVGAPLDRLMTFFLDEPPSSVDTTISLRTDYVVTRSYDTDSVVLDGLRLSLNDWDLSGEARLTRFQSDVPVIRVAGTATPLTLGRFVKLIPPRWLPENVRTFVTERKADGTVELVHGSVQGPLGTPEPLAVEGILRLQDGQFLIAEGHPSITNLSAGVKVDAKRIGIRDVMGTVGAFTIGVPEATVSLHDAGVDASLPTFQVSADDWSLTGQAEYLYQKQPASPLLRLSVSARPIALRPFLDLLPEAWLPDRVRAVVKERQLDGNLELVTGSFAWLMNGTSPMETEGVFRVDRGRVLIDSRHPPLTQVSGAAVFDAGLLRLFEAKGQMDASEVFLDEATVEFQDSDMWLDVRGGGNLRVPDLVRAVIRDPRLQTLARHVDDYRDFRGLIRIRTHVEGLLSRPEDFRIREGILTLDRLGMSPKEKGLSLSDLTGQVGFDHRRLVVRTLSGQLGTSPFEAQGQWAFRDGTTASNLTVRSSLEAEDLLVLAPPLSNIFSTFSGTLDTMLALNGTLSAPAYRLEVDLTDWAVASSGLFHKPAGISGTLTIGGHLQEERVLAVTSGALALPPYKLDIRGSLALRGPPQIRLGLRTESGTGALLPKGMSLGYEPLELSTLSINLTARGEDYDWTTWTMQGAVESTNRVRLSDSNGSEVGSKVFRLTWLQKDQQAKADVSIRNLLIQRLLPPDPPPRFIGSLTVQSSMVLDLTRTEWADRIATGTGKLQFRDGRILTSPVLSRILNVMNIPNLLMGKINILESGFPVERLNGTFEVEDGMFTTKDLALQSPVMALAATGTYTLPTDQFDAVVAVSPFGAYSSLLRKIPLFGTLLEGERQGLTTALFEVKGPRMDPDVTYLPIQSLGGGLLGIAKFPLDVLKNVLTLPMGDRKGGSDEEAGE